MKTKLWIFALIIIAASTLIISSCDKDEITYSTDDLTGVWKGELRVEIFGGDDPGVTIGTLELTFGPNGTFISLGPDGPTYGSISGNLTVAKDGKITGTITTTHTTEVGTETTSMNWAGSMFETKTTINVDMNWPWQNTAPGSGYFLITGSLTKQ